MKKEEKSNPLTPKKNKSTNLKSFGFGLICIYYGISVFT